MSTARESAEGCQLPTYHSDGVSGNHRSPKGDRFLFSATKDSKVSLWTFSLADRRAAPFDAVESTNVIGSVFSPDGRWVAYSSSSLQTGRSSNPNVGNVVYVQPFPATGAKYRISKSSPGRTLRAAAHALPSADPIPRHALRLPGEFDPRAHLHGLGCAPLRDSSLHRQPGRRWPKRAGRTR